MFSAFGSMINDDMENGLIETFQNNMDMNGLNSLNEIGSPGDFKDKSEMDKCVRNCLTQGASNDCKGLCGVSDSKDSEENTSEKEEAEEEEDSGTEDEEEEAANNEESYENENNEDVVEDEEAENTSSPTTGASSNKNGNEDDDSEDGEEDEEEDGEKVEENFVGYHNKKNIIEGFSSKNVAKKAMCPNLLLKSVLFACLFYILAHKDSKNFVINVVFKKVKQVRKQHYIYIATFLFLLIFYVISIFL